MKEISAFAILSLVLLFAATDLRAQEAPPPLDGDEPPEVAYSIKTITLSFFGGWFSGATFLDLPPLEARTQLEEGSDEVLRYDNTVFELPEYYDAPQKKIKPGRTFGGKVGFYLSEEFHLDLTAAVTFSEATTSFLNSDPENVGGPFREQLDVDDSFTIYKGGGSLMYDITTVDFFGFMPYFGLGLGGIINRFSHLEDKTALYFELTAGLAYRLGNSLRISTQFSATTLSFPTEELVYSKQVTYGYASVGIVWVIDATPDL